MKNFRVEISEETLQDAINIETGLLAPLTGFMCGDDVRSVVDTYMLPDGQVFTIPVTLDVPREIFDGAAAGDELSLVWNGADVASLTVKDGFIFSDDDIHRTFSTGDHAHPGVNKEKSRSPFRIGGRVRLLDKELLHGALHPEDTKQVFASKGWRTVVGFQTRNPIHRAHEHIQRLGLELCDGLFINPIVGWKKRGDFTEEAVMTAYDRMIKEFYPSGRVHIAGLRTQMRYAGPREAVFHAIIRRNLGCTHFIIGRDHAGVGGYYSAYEAHDLARSLSRQCDLGIELLLTREPYYCNKCGMIVTDNTCAHYATDRVEISGTIIRGYISSGSMPDDTMLRHEIFNALLSCSAIFIE